MTRERRSSSATRWGVFGDPLGEDLKDDAGLTTVPEDAGDQEDNRLTVESGTATTAAAPDLDAAMVAAARARHAKYRLWIFYGMAAVVGLGSLVLLVRDPGDGGDVFWGIVEVTEIRCLAAWRSVSRRLWVRSLVS